MSIEMVRENLSRSRELHHQLAAAGYTNGCVEVSLTALGAMINPSSVSPERQLRDLQECVNEAGFQVNWMVSADHEIAGEDISALFGGVIPLEEQAGEGEVLGYLWSEHYPDAPAHVMAILQEDTDSYVLVDSDNPLGQMHVHAREIAHLSNYVTTHGGQFGIYQIKQKSG